MVQNMCALYTSHSTLSHSFTQNCAAPLQQRAAAILQKHVRKVQQSQQPSPTLFMQNCAALCSCKPLPSFRPVRATVHHSQPPPEPPPGPCITIASCTALGTPGAHRRRGTSLGERGLCRIRGSGEGSARQTERHLMLCNALSPCCLLPATPYLARHGKQLQLRAACYEQRIHGITTLALPRKPLHATLAPLPSTHPEATPPLVRPATGPPHLWPAPPRRWPCARPAQCAPRAAAPPATPSQPPHPPKCWAPAPSAVTQAGWAGQGTCDQDFQCCAPAPPQSVLLKALMTLICCTTHAEPKLRGCACRAAMWLLMLRLVSRKWDQQQAHSPRHALLS